MRVSVVGAPEPSEGPEDAWRGPNRLRTLRNGEVVWTIGTGKVRRRYARTYSGIRDPQTIFAYFERELCCCTLVGDVIQVNSESGAEWDTSLPFRGKRIWANPLGGLLVERWLPPNRQNIAEDDPLIFSVSHPLDEAKPVELDRQSEVVWVSEDEPFLLTFSQVKRSHILWSITRSDATETDDMIRSEMVLVPLRTFSHQEWPAKISKAFHAHTVEKKQVVCILIKETQTLRGFSLGDSSTLDFTISDVIDASSVLGSTEDACRDVIILQANRTLHLWRGPLRLCELTVEGLGVNSIVRFPTYASPSDCLDVYSTDGTRAIVRISARPAFLCPVSSAVLEAARLSDPVLGLALSVDMALRKDRGAEFETLLDVFGALLSKSHDGSAVDSPKSSFDLLLASDYHVSSNAGVSRLFPSAQLRTRGKEVEQSTVSTSNGPLLIRGVVERMGLDLLSKLFFFGHLQYEGMKLHVLMRSHLPQLAKFLGGLCARLFSSQVFLVYDDVYRRDLGEAYTPIHFGRRPSQSDVSVQAVLPPPDAMEALFHAAVGSGAREEKIPWLGRVHELMAVFRALNEFGAMEAANRMVDLGLDLDTIETFPVGIQIALREILHRCRENPPVFLSKDLAKLISREDVYLSMQDEPRLMASSRMDQSDSPVLLKGPETHEDPDDDDDFFALQRFTRLRFGRDHRIKEVFKLLNSSKSPLVVVKRKPEMTDHDVIQAQQMKLKQLVGKAMAGTIGRGALMLFIKPNAYEKNVRVPDLAKTGRVPPQNVQIQLDEAHQVKASWPSFHNGVSAGLSIARRMVVSEASKDLIRSWVLFNKSKTPNETHAGILLALGLNKELAFLTISDQYEHLQHHHELTSIGVLLGLGCAKASSSDPIVRKTLMMYIPSLMPQAFSELDVVKLTVQAAALVGLGMLHRGTCNRLFCEFFLEEMVKSPSSDTMVEQRASYALSAGLALGLAALGHGAIEGGLAGLADLEIEERLNVLISGGPVAKFAHQVHAYADEDETAFSRTQKVAPVATRQAAAAGGGGNGLTADKEPKCSRVLEGTNVNTDLTAPGATIALGLIYLKSNDASASAKLAVPTTRFLLESIRPDFLLFRTWAQCLVMWDTVQPTVDWVLNLIPDCIDPALAEVGDVQDEKFLLRCRAYIVAGAALGIGCRFAGSMDQRARDCLLGLFHIGEDGKEEGDVTMAGSNEEDGDENGDDGVRSRKRTQSFFDKTGFLCADTCYSSVAVALGLVMAGSGDLETFKTLRLFRKLTKRYGAQQLAGMAVGFLFMGGGKVSFSTSNDAIASIVCSVLPILADSPEDNASYLQALRHLYVLATEPRCIEAFDADTGEACYAPLLVVLKQDKTLGELCCPPDLDDLFAASKGSKGGEQQEEEKSPETCLSAQRAVRIVAPATLPPLDQIESILVDSPRYWPLTVRPRRPPIHLVVKLRGDQLPYHVDPRGLACLSARPRPRAGAELLGSLRDFASKSPYLLAFARFLPNEFDAIYHSLLNDSVHALPAILEVASAQRGTVDLLQAEQLRFLKRYYEAVASRRGEQRLVPDRLLLLDLNRHATGDEVRRYIQGREGSEGLSMSTLIYLNLAGIPKLGQLSQLRLDTPDGLQQALSVVDPSVLLELIDATI